jgi:quinol monooxygenase YgiN
LKHITDAVGSRQEPGCSRFDVLRDPEQSNKFYFYEVYQNEAAIEAHRATPHFKVFWDFKVCFRGMPAR